MYGADCSDCSTSFNDGSDTAELAAGLDGRVAVWLCTSLVCTSALAMYLRKSAHAAVALEVQEKPSPPPSAAPGLPAPPGTDGNGNQPSLLANALSLVSGIMVGSSQSPCSS